MKILKIFGIVAGIHVFALILIFANPGCSSTAKRPPAAADTAAATEPPPTITVPNTSASSPSVSVPMGGSTSSPVSAAPAFNPNSPAVAEGGVRFPPTRPQSPAAAALMVEPVTDVTPVTTYTVKSGDSLWLIARKNGVSVSDITAANNLKGTVLHDGQKLIIPRKRIAPIPSAATNGTMTAKPAAAAASKGGAEVIKHVVKRGETLGTIARKYDVKQSEIAVANNISDPQRIIEGTELIIPGWQPPGLKGTKGSASDSATRSSSAKSGADGSRSLFSAPTPIPGAAAQPPATNDVPVIKVDETPTAPNP